MTARTATQLTTTEDKANIDNKQQQQMKNKQHNENVKFTTTTTKQQPEELTNTFTNMRAQPTTMTAKTANKNKNCMQSKCGKQQAANGKQQRTLVKISQPATPCRGGTISVSVPCVYASTCNHGRPLCTRFTYHTRALRTRNVEKSCSSF